MYAAGQVVVNASQAAGFSNDKNKQNKIVNEPNFQKVNEEYANMDVNIKNKNTKSEISDNKSKKCNIL